MDKELHSLYIDIGLDMNIRLPLFKKSRAISCTEHVSLAKCEILSVR